MVLTVNVPLLNSMVAQADLRRQTDMDLLPVVKIYADRDHQMVLDLPIQL
jgi:hypothetical protein